MTAAEFNRHVTRKLCWVDGSPTHASGARQRECKHCRRKWSYKTLAKSWILAQEYCAGRNRIGAASAAGVDVHTAGRHYAEFESALARHLRRMLAARKAWKLGDAERLYAPFRRGLRGLGARQRRRLAARICFDGLGARRRLTLLHELVFEPKLRRLIGRRKSPADPLASADARRGRVASPMVQ